MTDRTMIDDIHACASDALAALEAGNPAGARTELQALLDTTRAALDSDDDDGATITPPAFRDVLISIAASVHQLQP